MIKNIFFLGCGKMGGIIAKNLRENKDFSSCNFLVLKPSESNKINNLTYIDNLNKLPQNYITDIVFICIKPQESKTILEEFAQTKIFHKDTIFISILAGKNLNFFSKIFGSKKQIVRSMPNLAIEVNQGIIPYIHKNLSTQNQKIIAEIFANFGTAFEVEDEKLFHVLTALYGCGPAYIFLMQKIFFDIAISHKIPAEIAYNLTKKLFLGSSLLSSQSAIDFSKMIENVASKKGVTEASLENLLKNDKLHKLISKSSKNGINRSKRLR
jgi:pyrroline-5-carboxylate reductase